MFPVLLNIQGFTLSSFGLFLLLAFASAFFVIWRIIRLYEVDPEKIIDLSLFTFIGGLIGARIYFILIHLDQFNTPEKLVNIYRFPGLSLWGGLIGGLIVLYFINRKLKLRFWQSADMVVTAFFAGLILGNIGCLLGGCSSGETSALPIAVTQIGLIGKRLPVQLFEAIASAGIFYYLWKGILKFHIDGQIAGRGLVVFGILKLIFEPLRPANTIIGNINLAYIFSGLVFFTGLWVLYNRSKKSVKQDLAYSVSLISHQNRRKQALSSVRKWWYNLYVRSVLSLGRLKKRIFKAIHVKANPDQF